MGTSHAADDSLGVLIFLFLNVLLNHLWVETLKAIWLDLETVVKISEVLNVVVNCLAPLLLLG